MTEYKNYKIVPDGKYGMVAIFNSGSGVVPSVLKGAFTTGVVAMRAIDTYLDRKKKVKSDGEAASTS